VTGATPPSAVPPATRKGYLDWLRGAAVILMIQGHAVDSWTRLEDKSEAAYRWISMTWGVAAPLFLFLAGVSLVLAAGARLRQGRTDEEAAALARRRGLQIFGLAFLFRLQAWLISGGEAYRTLLKVDILNVMGLAMLAGAILWGLGRGQRSRALLLAGAAVAAAMLTPIVRATPLLAPLPDPIEWYLRPFAGATTFTLLPWAGFLLAGGAVGFWIDSARTARDERVVNGSLAIVGILLAVGGYAASFLPPIYAVTNFWTSSPTFFFLRLGIVIALVPLAFLVNADRPASARRRRASARSRRSLGEGGKDPRRSPVSDVRGGPSWAPTRDEPRWLRSAIQDFGRSSLFVYWIHVEMAYGIFSAPIHRRLPLEWAIVGWVLLTLLLFALVKGKERLKRHHIGHLRDHRAAQHLARAFVPAFVIHKEEIAQRTVNDVKPQV
jgi:uncharacterized membrane protein